MSKNVFVYAPIGLWNIHFVEALEIALAEHYNGNNVYMYQCEGNLASCAPNPLHDRKLCNLCKRKTKRLIKKIAPFVKTTDLRLSQFPDIQIPEFSSLDDLIDFEYQSCPLGGMAVNQIADNLKDAYFQYDNYRDGLKSELRSALQLYLKSSLFFREEDIHEVYAWNGRRPSDGPVLYAGRSNNLSVHSFISGPALGSIEIIDDVNIFSLGHRKRALDEIRQLMCSSDDYAKQVMVEGKKFFDNQSGQGPVSTSLGIGSISKWFGDTLAEEITKSEKPILAIFTSSVWEKLGIREFDNKIYLSELEGIVKILSEDKITDFFNVVVRWHPGLRTAGPGELGKVRQIAEAFAHKSVQITPESDSNSYGLVDISSIVVSFGSTIGVEATHRGVASISLGPSYYQNLDVCYYPCTHTEFIELLFSKLTPKSKELSLVYGYYEINRTSRPMRHIEFKNGRFMCKGKGIFFYEDFLKKIKYYIIYSWRHVKHLFGFFD
jgi:hypothetical protein